MSQSNFPQLEDASFAKQLPVKVFVGADHISYNQLKTYIRELIALKRTYPIFYKGHDQALEHLLLDLEADHMVYEAKQE